MWFSTSGECNVHIRVMRWVGQKTYLYLNSLSPFFNSSVQLEKDRAMRVCRKLCSSSPCSLPLLCCSGPARAWLSPIFLPAPYHGWEERTCSHFGKISPFPKPGYYFGNISCLPEASASPTGEADLPLPALTHCKPILTLRSKSHLLGGNPSELLMDWKWNKGFNKRFNHRIAIALLGCPCRVRVTAHI